MAPGILAESPRETYGCSQKEKLVDAGQQVQQWPKHFTSEMAWNGHAFQTEQDYTTVITQAENEEIAAGIAIFLGMLLWPQYTKRSISNAGIELGLDGSEINPENFPLPTLAAKLRDCAIQIHSGKGFVNIRGINFEGYTREESILVFLGLSGYIAERRAKQDSQGNMVMHICDAKSSAIRQEDRPTRFSTRASVSTWHINLDFVQR